MRETAVEWLEDCFDRYGTLLKSDFIKAKEMEKQQQGYSEKQMDDSYDKGFNDAIEKMYSEEEVRLMLRELSSDLYEIYPLESLEQWFEQFKKK